MSVGKFVNLGAVALKNNFVRLSEPYKLTFAITYRCQSRCLTCNIWQMHPTNELTLEEITEFAKKNNSFRWIEITGGEPFLRSDIVEIIKAFNTYSKGLYIVTIPTNSLTNHELIIRKIDEILATGLPRLSITVSLDGYRELHDKIRGVPGNFDRAIELAKKLKELQEKHKNLFFVFGYTLSNFNQGQLERTYEEVKKLLPWVERENFHINVAQLSDIYYSNTNLSINASREALAGEVASFVKKRKVGLDTISLIEGVFLKNLVKYINTGKSPMPSRSLDASLFLDSYGNVYPSIMWGRKLGNIRDTQYSLKSIWHNSEAEEVRKIIKEGKEPQSWTACEAYQAIVGDIKSFTSLILP